MALDAATFMITTVCECKAYGIINLGSITETNIQMAGQNSLSKERS